VKVNSACQTLMVEVLQFSRSRVVKSSGPITVLFYHPRMRSVASTLCVCVSVCLSVSQCVMIWLLKAMT